MTDVSYRYAHEGDAAELSAVAFRSKGHWGYPDEFMEACRGELTYTGRAIDSEESTFIVADAAGKIAGFIALLRLDVDTAELEGLFVDPDFIGYGIGKALMQQAIDCVASLNLKKIIIQADPNAARFYESVGAEACGERESVSIPGRMLPLYQLHL